MAFSQEISKQKATAAQWLALNPVLPSGVYGYETDTVKLKIGDGAKAWTALGYTDYKSTPIDTILPADDIPVTAQPQFKVLSSKGVYKASYDTIDLAVAALTADDILVLPNGEFTIVDKIDVPAACSIVGSGSTVVKGGTGAYCFKTVLTNTAASKTINFKDFKLSHKGITLQQGFSVDNKGATSGLTVNVDNVDTLANANGSSFYINSGATGTFLLSVKNSDVNGSIRYFLPKATDTVTIDNCHLTRGYFSSATNVASETFIKDSVIKAGGITGGHSSQLVAIARCTVETQASPNVYAGATASIGGSQTKTCF